MLLSKVATSVLNKSLNRHSPRSRRRGEECYQTRAKDAESPNVLISDFRQTPLISNSDFDEANPVVALVSPETAFVNELDIPNAAHAGGHLFDG